MISPAINDKYDPKVCGLAISTFSTLLLAWVLQKKTPQHKLSIFPSQFVATVKLGDRL
jgi:hypothetical protein